MTFDIFAMQLFNGLSSFTILLLMALGAYMTYLTARLFEHYLPGLMHRGSGIAALRAGFRPA
jgi:urea transport system permease protein